MQVSVFSGRVAAPVELSGNESKVAKVTLIDNAYAGKDEQGGSKTEKVSIRFIAFGKRAEVLQKHLNTGDQVIFRYEIRNNDYETEAGKRYGYNFIVQDFEFAAKKNPAAAG